MNCSGVGGPRRLPPSCGAAGPLAGRSLRGRRSGRAARNASSSSLVTLSSRLASAGKTNWWTNGGTSWVSSASSRLASNRRKTWSMLGGVCRPVGSRRLGPAFSAGAFAAWARTARRAAMRCSAGGWAERAQRPQVRRYSGVNSRPSRLVSRAAKTASVSRRSFIRREKWLMNSLRSICRLPFESAASMSSLAASVIIRLRVYSARLTRPS